MTAQQEIGIVASTRQFSDELRSGHVSMDFRYAKYYQTMHLMTYLQSFFDLPLWSILHFQNQGLEDGLTADLSLLSQ